MNPIFLSILLALSIFSCTLAQITAPVSGFAPPPPSPPVGGLPTGAVVGIVIGVLFGAFAIIFSTCCYIRYKFSSAGLSAGPTFSFSAPSPRVYMTFDQPQDDNPYVIYNGEEAGANEDQQGEFDVNGIHVRYHSGSNPPQWARDQQDRANRQHWDGINRMHEDIRRRNEEDARRSRERNQRMMDDQHRRNMENIHRTNQQMHQNIMHSNMQRQHQQQQQFHQQQNMMNQQRMQQQQQQQQQMFRPPMH